MPGIRPVRIITLPSHAWRIFGAPVCQQVGSTPQQSPTGLQVGIGASLDGPSIGEVAMAYPVYPHEALRDVCGHRQFR
jgi:hypothetical protein